VTVDPETGEILDVPDGDTPVEDTARSASEDAPSALAGPPRPGVHLWSLTRRWNDSPVNQTPLGGHLIETFTDNQGDTVRVVAEIHRGRVEYHHLRDDDVDWESYDGTINTAFLSDVVRVMHAESARSHLDHLHALLAWSPALR
jgi:hypothetical protein